MEVNTNWVDVQIVRGPLRGEHKGRVGLVYHIKARPDVEDFMKAQSNHNKVLVEAVGDNWTNAVPSNPPLEYYDADITAGRGYNLAQINGTPLIAGDLRKGPLGLEATPEVANLAFLRLVGISNPEGIALGFAGAYSKEYVERVRAAVPTAIKRFLEDYVVPITINLHIVSKGF